MIQFLHFIKVRNRILPGNPLAQVEHFEMKRYPSHHDTGGHGEFVPAFTDSHFFRACAAGTGDQRQLFRGVIQDKIMGQTRLTMVNQNGDLAFEGEITGYTLQPVAIQGNETSQLTQLTVNINVRFFNRLDDSKNFEARFSRFQQFPSSSSLTSVEDGLVETITEELVDDIFNKALVNW